MSGQMANLIIYDGECIFCQNYVRFVRLRDSIGPVELLDARSCDPRIAVYVSRGYDLDVGMLFVHGDRVYHGADAINVLARLSSDKTLSSRVNNAIFSSELFSRVSYPLLRAGRRVTLLLRGKKTIRRSRQEK
jgi:predicted DCC family thiol-disulfide oxidoreductase YuxK